MLPKQIGKRTVQTAGKEASRVLAEMLETHCGPTFSLGGSLLALCQQVELWSCYFSVPAMNSVPGHQSDQHHNSAGFP